MQTMADKKTTPAPATKTGADADKSSTNNIATPDRTMSKEELDKVTGGGGEPTIVRD
jgi:bacteriocin-like protein